MEVTLYRRHSYGYHESIDNFRENLLYGELRYFASELSDYGLTDPDALETAVHRAMQVCDTMGIRPESNFRPVYSFKNGTITPDWRLSVLGRKLVLLNSSPCNPYVAMLQMRLIEQLREF